LFARIERLVGVPQPKPHEEEDPMRTFVTASVVSVLLSATGAFAESILTTPPVVHTEGAGITCVAINPGNQPRFMKADVLEAFSDDALDSEQENVDPGGMVSASGDGNYCRFTVQKKSETRAAMQVFDSEGKTLAVVGAE
jgi:hypothetical protein